MCTYSGRVRGFRSREGRRYTPADAPKELLFKLHERLGIQHCVIVQPACHGADNSVTVDAIAATGGAYKGVALVPLSISDAELKRLDAAGLCGARFHYMDASRQGSGSRTRSSHSASVSRPSDGICKCTWKPT